MALYFLYQRVARREGSAPAVRNASTAGGAEALGGDVQGRAPVLVGCVDLRPQLQQQADLVLVGPAGALVKGAPAVVVGGVDVLAALHEPADEFVGAGCDVQGRGPAALAGADLAVGQFGEGLFDPALSMSARKFWGRVVLRPAMGVPPPVRVRVRAARRPRRHGTRAVRARPRASGTVPAGAGSAVGSTRTTADIGEASAGVGAVAPADDGSPSVTGLCARFASRP